MIKQTIVLAALSLLFSTACKKRYCYACNTKTQTTAAIHGKEVVHTTNDSVIYCDLTKKEIDTRIRYGTYTSYNDSAITKATMSCVTMFRSGE